MNLLFERLAHRAPGDSLIICFFGADGSGKTTLARELAKRLSDERVVVKLSWMRGTHTLASLLAKILYKSTYFRGPENPYYRITIPRSLKRLWQLVEFSSALPVILLKFILPSALGYWVIAERYAPDFIAWVSLTTSDQHYPETLEAKFLLTLSSKTHAKIYVTASLEELLKRRKRINPNFLINQLKLYNMMALAIGAHCLDTTNKTVDDSLGEVLSLLNIR